MKTEFVVVVLALLGMLFAVAMALRSLFRKQSIEVRQVEDSSPSLLVQTDFTVRCVCCGDVATQPMPTLRRSRGDLDILRKWFATGPRIVRFVDKNAPLALCEVHAHVADARMDEFIYTRVRAILSEANAKIAMEAASFEKDVMLKSLDDSLTEREKKARRMKSNNVVSITSNDSREAQG